MIDYYNCNEIHADRRFGQPCIKGTRIRIYDVQSMLVSGMVQSAISADFPELTSKHVLAALLFAASREHTLQIAS